MKPVLFYLGTVALCAVLFLVVPQLDLFASGLFYAAGRGFFLKNWAPVEFVYGAVPWLARGIVVFVVCGFAWLFLFRRPFWRLDRRALCFLVLAIALGPGLIVNTVLKDHWGRARPSEIEAFGGARQFTPAPLPAAECPHNCSFPSGHAALGYSLVAFAFLLPAGVARRRGVAASLGLGSLVGLARIAQGAHFLSDVVYAGLIVYGETAVLHWWVVERDGLATPAAAIGSHVKRAWTSPAVRLGSGTAATAMLVMLSIDIWDRPLARYFHSLGPGIHALAGGVGRLGLGYGWLILFAGGFAVLHWGGAVPRLQPLAKRLRDRSPIPAFLFASVAASGIAADVLKVVLGRARPKLFFTAKLYGFTWFGWHADLWSFPSGHSATIVSLLAALWHLWPSHILFYVVVGAAVAGSRVVVGAHYLSDTIAGAWLGVLTTRGIVLLFVHGGIDLAAARRGEPPVRVPPGLCRRMTGIALFGRRQRAPSDPGGSLHPPRGL